jgi:Flp pilus assembly protein TadG
MTTLSNCNRAVFGRKFPEIWPNKPAANLKVENLCRSCRRNRRGAAVVEFAFVAPVFILLVLGMIEMGRGVMVQQIITNASREGARSAVLDNSTVSGVQTTVKNYLTGTLGAAASTAATVNVTIPAQRYGNAATVSVSIPYSNVSWVPIAKYLSGKSLSASSTMRCESVQ